MNQNQQTRTFFSGQVRSGLLHGIEDRGDHVVAHSIKLGDKLHCKQVQTGRERAEAQRFWLSRYREAGLIGQVSDNVDTSSFAVPSSLEKSKDPVFAIKAWRPLLFTAHRQGVKRSRTDFTADNGPNRLVIENSSVSQLCGTVTLMVPDRRDDDDFSQGPNIGRITRLAIDHGRCGPESVGASYHSIFMELTSCMHQTAISMGLDYLDAIVHPRHAKLYRRIFGAKPIGLPFECREVGGSPGQYMRADVSNPSQFHSRIRARYGAQLGQL